MKLRGTVKNLSLDCESGMLNVMFQCDSSYVGDLHDLKDVDIEIKKHSEKRSLDSNAYFHVLCDKLRQKLNVSMSYMKNMLITSYGQIEYLDDAAPLIYKTNAPEHYMSEREEVHAKLVESRIEKGIEIYFYRIYRGSHTYTGAEMAKLIEGTVQEAKEQGIETLTPAELARLNELWRRKHG